MALTALLILPTMADAVTGLQWQFAEGAVARYEISARVLLPEALTLRAQQNLDARVTEIWIDLRTTCKPLVIGKKAWELECGLDDLQLRAAPHGPDAKRLPPILGELDEMLSGSLVQIEMGLDGRVRSVDVEGLPKNNQRQQHIQEVSRLLMARTFAAIDLQLPKKGDSGDDGVWRQKQVLAMQFVSQAGSLGNVNVQHTLSGEGPVHTITTKGGGVVASGEMIAVANEEKPKYTYDLKIEGSATFDRESGRLVSREYVVAGSPGPSSILNQVGDYVQVVTLTRLEVGDDLEPFGPSIALPIGGSLAPQ